MALIKTVSVPIEQRKKTTLATNLYYDTVEVYDSKAVGYLDGQQKMAWYFKDYIGIDVIKAGLNSQFAQIVFLTGINSKNKVVGVDLRSAQNMNAMKTQAVSTTSQTMTEISSTITSRNGNLNVAATAAASSVVNGLQPMPPRVTTAACG